MFLSKRISKLRTKSLTRTKKTPKKSLKLKDPHRSQRCCFKIIPQSTKFSYANPIYLVSGDFPIMEYKGELVMDLSFYNESKIYQDLSIKEMYNQRVLQIKPIPRKDKQLPSWIELVEKLNQSKDSEALEWAKILQVFCPKYIKVMRRQSRKKTKSEPRKKFFVEVTQKTENQKQRIFEEYPCFQLKFRLKNHENLLNEIIINESFINELGYSMDSFITMTLQEGLPRMMAHETSSTNFLLKTLITQYFAIEDDGSTIGELKGTLIMKDSFEKEIIYQTFLLMNYETNTFGMDVIIALVAKGEPTLIPKRIQDFSIDESFRQIMSVQEMEASSFLSMFYNYSIQCHYTNLHRICSVRELDCREDDDCIIVKKDEDM